MYSQILVVSDTSELACKLAAGDHTLKVTFLSIGLPSKYHNASIQKRLQDAQVAAADLHDTDMDQRLS